MKAPRPVALLLLVVLAACGATARERAISAAYVGINSARDGFIAYNAKHENDLVDSSQSREEAVSKLVNYRLKRNHVDEAFIAAYHMLSSAVLLENDPKSLPNLLQAAAELRAAIAALEKE